MDGESQEDLGELWEKIVQSEYIVYLQKYISIKINKKEFP